MEALKRGLRRAALRVVWLVGGLGHDDGRALDGERVLVSLGRLSPLILIGAVFPFSPSVSDEIARH